jgi:hypothetical protein
MGRKPNIFREVRDWRETVESRIADDVYNDDLEIEHKRLEAIDEILRYLKTLAWISHGKTKERIQYYLKKAGLNARTTAAALGTSVNAIEVSVKYVSDKIRSLIDVPLSVIEQAKDVSNVESGLADFRKVTETGAPVYRHFLAGVEPFLPKPQYNPKFSLADCKKEISRITVFAQYMTKYFLARAGSCAFVDKLPQRFEVRPRSTKSFVRWRIQPTGNRRVSKNRGAIESDVPVASDQ